MLQQSPPLLIIVDLSRRNREKPVALFALLVKKIDNDRMKQHQIHFTIEIQAAIETLWEMWSTEDGLHCFFSPKINVHPEPGGKFEILFDTDAEKGKQGSEGMIIMAMEEPWLFSFTWNAPPTIPRIRGQRTFVEVRFEQINKERTRVALNHYGFGNSEDWQKTRTYFLRAWGEIVLPRLKKAAEEGPVDWQTL